jgi:hypothetical protein
VRIYLCARYSRRDELRGYRDQLHALGHVVVSRWLDTEWAGGGGSGSSAAPPEYRRRHAAEDLDDVERCDCLVFFAEPPRSAGRGGRHVEFGIALAHGKRVIVVGEPENLFHYHPSVMLAARWAPDLIFGKGAADA